MTRTIRIEGIGPIRDAIEFELPEGGGIVPLLGSNGAGKSTALRAVQRLTDGTIPLEPTDGLDRGIVEGLGVRLTVGKLTRASGRLEVHSLDGVNPMLLVDPGFKEPIRNDEERVRVLCRLIKVRLENEAFAGLVGGLDELRAVVAPKSLTIDDAVDKTAAFRRDFQSAAKKLEDQSAVQEHRAEGLRQSVEQIRQDSPADERELAAETEAALRASASADGEAKAARARLSKHAEARKRLDQAAADRGGVSSDDAKEQLDAAKIALSMRMLEESAAQQRVADLKRELEQAEAERRSAVERTAGAASAVQAAEKLLRSARDAEQTLADARALVDADPGASGPSDEVLSALRAEVEEARKRQEYGAVVRAARETLAKSKDAAAEGRALREKSVKYREAADGCEELLTIAIQAIAPRGLRVKNSRLGMPTARGPFTIFDELSMGERTTVAIDVTADALGENSLFVLPQEFFEGLDPHNVRALHEHLIARKCHMVTACADGGPLRAEPYVPDEAALASKPASTNGTPKQVTAEEYQ